MGQEKWALAASFPRVQLLQKGAIKLSPLPAGCLPTPLQWKEIPMRGVQLPEPCLEGCPPPGSLATGLSIISLAFPAPQLLSSCQAGVRFDRRTETRLLPRPHLGDMLLAGG